MPCHRVVRRVVRAWDGLQVELLGRYSPARLNELIEATKHSNLLTATLIMVAIPSYSLLAILFLDALPLHSSKRGVYHQTVWFWFRVAVSVGLITFCVTQQMAQSSPKLHLPTRRVAAISLALGLCAIPSFFSLGIIIGFPTPFALQLTSIPWFWMLVGVLWFTWRGVLHTDPTAWDDFKRYTTVYTTQFTITFLYPMYYYVFTLLSSRGQTIASVGFAALRLGFRFWCHKGVFHIEDLAPTTIIFNVDVFHALYVSSTMQQATSSGTIVATMAVDIAQGVIGFIQVHQLLCQLHALTPTLPSPPGFVQLHPLEYAHQILEENTFVRTHPAIALPRHSRRRMQTFKIAPGSIRTALRADTTQLQAVASVLQLLHLTEFLVLVEFVEVVVAALYSLYLFAMSMLPNRVYYAQMANLTDVQLRATAASVGIYALAELVSFVGFCYVLDRRIRFFSTFHQLAFVLRKHSQTARTMTTLWVIFVVQLSLEHAGSDYTFEFKWLHENNTVTRE